MSADILNKHNIKDPNTEIRHIAEINNKGKDVCKPQLLTMEYKIKWKKTTRTKH